jgi:hypothetical protein
MEKKIKSLKPAKKGVKGNSKYKLEKYDFESKDYEEGDIHNFQIYSVLSK